MSEPLSNLNNAIRDMLLDCGLFDTLLPGDFFTVAGYFSITDIDKGETIFAEGDAGTFMCIIHQGTVSVQKLAADGQQVEIAVLRRGRAFGEMAVLDGERRSASCIAATSCQLLNWAVIRWTRCSRMRRKSPPRSFAPGHLVVQAPAHGRWSITLPAGVSLPIWR